jgi:hypothetical protein
MPNPRAAAAWAASDVDVDQPPASMVCVLGALWLLVRLQVAAATVAIGGDPPRRLDRRCRGSGADDR